MDWLDKIIKDAGPAGEEPRRRAFTLPRLTPYLWDPHLARTLCTACLQGSGRIIALTWQWCRAAAPGDRLLRAGAPVGAIAGAGWAAAQQPLNATVGIIAAWLAAAAWLTPRAVWAAPAPEVPEPPLEEAPELSEDDLHEWDRLALLVLLEEATRGRNGVHLGELHQPVSAHPRFAGLPRAHMGALLEGFGVPVQRTLSVDGVEGRSGVRRADVETLLLALPREDPDTHSQPSESGDDQQFSRPLSAPSRTTLGPLSVPAQGV